MTDKKHLGVFGQLSLLSARYNNLKLKVIGTVLEKAGMLIPGLGLKAAFAGALCRSAGKGADQIIAARSRGEDIDLPAVGAIIAKDAWGKAGRYLPGILPHDEKGDAIRKLLPLDSAPLDKIKSP